MNRTMTNVTNAEVASALEHAREQGRLSGEVRVLKWAAGAAFVAIIAALGAIYTEMNQGFRDVSPRIDQLTHSVTDVRERLARVEGRIERIEGRVERIDGHIERIEGRVERIDGHIERIDGHIERIDGHIERIDGHIERIDGHIERVATARTPRAPESPP